MAPPQRDRWGQGPHVPTIVISPYARRGYIDHTVYDFTSVLALIEHRFGLAPLAGHDAAADPLSGGFAIGATPASPLMLRPQSCPIIPGVNISGAEQGGNQGRGSNQIALQRVPVNSSCAGDTRCWSRCAQPQGSRPTA